MFSISTCSPSSVVDLDVPVPRHACNCHSCQVADAKPQMGDIALGRIDDAAKAREALKGHAVVATSEAHNTNMQCSPCKQACMHGCA